MTLLLAAVGATGAALFELTVGPYLKIGGAQPHFVFVLGVVLTIAVGLEAGLVWAFVGGLALDVLAQRPLGSTSFALLLCMGGAFVMGRAFARVRPIAPVIGMNAGRAALGPGKPSAVNTAIGRAFRLIMMNVGYAYVGIFDLDTDRKSVV